jgi:hypothetical protein
MLNHKRDGILLALLEQNKTRGSFEKMLKYVSH